MSPANPNPFVLREAPNHYHGLCLASWERDVAADGLLVSNKHCIWAFRWQVTADAYCALFNELELTPWHLGFPCEGCWHFDGETGICRAKACRHILEARVGMKRVMRFLRHIVKGEVVRVVGQEAEGAGEDARRAYEDAVRWTREAGEGDEGDEDSEGVAK